MDNNEKMAALLAGQISACTVLINALIGTSTETNLLTRVSVTEHDRAVMTQATCDTDFERAMYQELAAHLQRFMDKITERNRVLQGLIDAGTVISLAPLLDPAKTPPLSPDPLD